MESQQPQQPVEIIQPKNKRTIKKSTIAIIALIFVAIGGLAIAGIEYYQSAQKDFEIADLQKAIEGYEKFSSEYNNESEEGEEQSETKVKVGQVIRNDVRIGYSAIPFERSNCQNCKDDYEIYSGVTTTSRLPGDTFTIDFGKPVKYSFDGFAYGVQEMDLVLYVLEDNTAGYSYYYQSDIESYDFVYGIIPELQNIVGFVGARNSTNTGDTVLAILQNGEYYDLSDVIRDIAVRKI